jgi:hypothetical protein
MAATTRNMSKPKLNHIHNYSHLNTTKRYHQLSIMIPSSSRMINNPPCGVVGYHVGL